MLQFIKNDFPGAKRGQSVYFYFEKDFEHIELKFDTPQEEPFTGWNIKPHIKPCRVSSALSFYCIAGNLEGFDFDEFGDFHHFQN